MLKYANEEKKTITLQQFLSRYLPESIILAMDSTNAGVQGESAGVLDSAVQEQIYQKIKVMKENYFGELAEIHQRIVAKLQMVQGLEALLPSHHLRQLELLKKFKMITEDIMAMLQLPKDKLPVPLECKFATLQMKLYKMITWYRSFKLSPPPNRPSFCSSHLPSNFPVLSLQPQRVDNSAIQNEASEPIPENVSGKESNYSCPICLCTITAVWSTICGHVFCEDCIKQSLKKKKTCPTCRTKLTARTSVHRVFLP